MGTWSGGKGWAMANWRARGGWWVVGQFILLGLVAFLPRHGPRWPRSLTWGARLVALPLLGVGGWLVASAPGALGANLTPFPRPRSTTTLVREGIYAEVRHPIYGGLIMLACGWALLSTSARRLGAAGALVALFTAKARREEAWLTERFPAYAAYRDEVPRFLPSPW